AWGSDAISTASWVLAQTSKIKVGTGIIQMSARTPAMAAMTAMTLQQLSGDRFILGIGPSGPQVIEGWHGEAYGRPLTRTREYIEIIRKIEARDGPLTYDGFHYQIPKTGAGTTGLGKPLKGILHSVSPLKIVTGTIAPAGVRVSAEIADGMIPVFMNPDRFDVFEDALNDGFAKAGGGKSLDNFTITPFCGVNLNDDEDAARQPARENLGLYIGGMGARDKNFYNDYAKRLGHEAAAVEIQDHFLSGRRAEALAAVPNELIDQVALTGPAGKITERLQEWKASGKVDSLLARCNTSAELNVLAKAVL
ncbi:MAG: LLM class F420-dependent oxidoreductase, partial [Rhodospirillaceae bacterium]|nr:LLM class F420-dependent oxidoreductase [Rhodospirillaceae bacterium]